MTRNYIRTSAQVLIATSLIAGLGGSASAQGNFFGGQMPSGPGGGGQASPSQTANPYADPAMPKGDFTEDEKRMQKKFKLSVKHAKGLVAKGEKMIEADTKSGKQDKEYKKGKILKEIGEKQLAELQANNPLVDLTAGDKKPKTAQSKEQVTQ